jgi:hypothetical protein
MFLFVLRRGSHRCFLLFFFDTETILWMFFSLVRFSDLEWKFEAQKSEVRSWRVFSQTLVICELLWWVLIAKYRIVIRINTNTNGNILCRAIKRSLNALPRPEYSRYSIEYRIFVATLNKYSYDIDTSISQLNKISPIFYNFSHQSILTCQFALTFF